MNEPLRISRRSMLLAGGAVAASMGVPRWAHAVSQSGQSLTLKAGPATASLSGPKYPATKTWGYNGGVPGPIIRIRRGERFRAVVENGLAEPTTVHWHGLRIPVAMDGVPVYSQPPIEAGKSFTYDFTPPDAGTFWYHPHINSTEQVGRGLSGALIVEEPEPVKVDRELVWVLDDWRLGKDEQIAQPMNNRHDMSHAGRLGNIATINGQSPATIPVRAGERIRLRLVNVANARFFALKFTGHTPRIIALDGQPCTPHDAPDGRVVLAPAQRADIILDCSGKPGEKFKVEDGYFARQTYALTEIAYSTDKPLRDSPLDASIRLPANGLPEPDLPDAARHEIVFEGGAMRGFASGRGMMGMGGSMMDMRQMVQAGVFWTLNQQASPPGEMGKVPVLAKLKRGQPARISMVNKTAFPHPMHLHGHHFRVLTVNGAPAPYTPWRDTVVVDPDETVEVAFVADNPGQWMFHCHVLEHLIAGMMGIIEVG